LIEGHPADAVFLHRDHLVGAKLHGVSRVS
jgi:hypothetical protein